MTAEERAKDIVESVLRFAERATGREFVFKDIVDLERGELRSVQERMENWTAGVLRAHATAMRERSATVAEKMCAEEEFHGHNEICPICSDIANRIRALTED